MDPGGEVEPYLNRAMDALSIPFKAELDRLRGGAPNALFHYTTKKGKSGIESSGSFRASNVGRLSDFTELRYAAAIMGACIDRLYGSERDRSALQLFQEMRLRFRSIDFRGVFVVSLTPDTASEVMWNLYADRGTGCALEFHLDRIESWGNPKHRPLLLRCEYGDDAVIGTCLALLKAIRQVYLQLQSGGGALNTGCYLEMCFNQVRWFAPIFKPAVFSDEKEWRLVFIEPSLLDDDCLELPLIQNGQSVLSAIRPGPACHG